MNIHQTVLFPGECIPFDETEAAQVRIGRGLTYFCVSRTLRATHVGRLVQPAKKAFYIDYYCKKYTPAVGDSVIGQVVVKHAEGYKVDINGARLGRLGALAFENATRKNRPNLQIGALVYAQVVYADKEMEPEIECISGTNEKSTTFGELKGGFLIHGLSNNLCQKILNKNYPLLQTLGESIPFEIAVGSNGRIWVYSKHVGITIALVQAIKKSELLNNDDIVQICQETIKEAQKWL
ncbi:hypothetical protein PORY_000724 [Pneumocystis oryctolagi]|uniref:Uncharacterized protein n=1 Tax=Pneumocystis oryctolagi TaxID=42067 RepID=A0ACB7CDI5_9ASCO|nr:hypothetical protein PORY_000724 [Pneumocystis oryctolagi]